MKQSQEIPLLPQIFPAWGTFFSILKDIKLTIDINASNIYHLWLDCLYDEDVTIQKFQDEIYSKLPCLKNNKSIVKPDHILILGEKEKDSEVIKLTGSCYLIIPKESKGHNFSKTLESAIIKSKFHMIRVNDLLPTSFLTNKFPKHLLVFTDAYHTKFKKFNIKTQLKGHARLVFPSFKEANVPEPNKNQDNNEHNYELVQQHIQRLQQQNCDVSRPMGPAAIQAYSVNSFGGPLRPVPYGKMIQPENNAIVNSQAEFRSCEELSSELSTTGSSSRLTIDTTQDPSEYIQASLDQVSHVIECPEQERVILRSAPEPRVKIESDLSPIQSPDVEIRQVEKAKSGKSVDLEDFMLITEETVDEALNLMSKFENEDRCVAFIIDDCFRSLSVDLIKIKYEPFFGNLKNNLIYILSDNQSNILLRDQNAIKNGTMKITAQNRGFIIGPKESGNDKATFERLKSKGLFCGQVTLDSVIVALKKGKLLYPKGIFMNSKSQSRSSKRPVAGNAISKHNDITLVGDVDGNKGSSTDENIDVGAKNWKEILLMEPTRKQANSVMMTNIEGAFESYSKGRRGRRSRRRKASQEESLLTPGLVKELSLKNHNNSGYLLRKQKSEEKKLVQQAKSMATNVKHQQKLVKAANSSQQKPEIKVKKPVAVSNELKNIANTMDSKALEAALINHENTSEGTNDFIKRYLNLGNTIVKVERLPANVTVEDFNQMCHTDLNQKRIIASKYKLNGKELNDLRIIIDKPQLKDLNQILGRNGSVCNGIKINSKKSNIQEFESFLRKNYGKIANLPSNGQGNKKEKIKSK